MTTKKKQPKPPSANDSEGVTLPLEAGVIQVDKDHCGLCLMLSYDVIMQVAVQMTLQRNKAALAKSEEVKADK